MSKARSVRFRDGCGRLGLSFFFDAPLRFFPSPESMRMLFAVSPGPGARKNCGVRRQHGPSRNLFFGGHFYKRPACFWRIMDFGSMLGPRFTAVTCYSAVELSRLRGSGSRTRNTQDHTNPQPKGGISRPRGTNTTEPYRNSRQGPSPLHHRASVSGRFSARKQYFFWVWGVTHTYLLDCSFVRQFFCQD